MLMKASNITREWTVWGAAPRMVGDAVFFSVSLLIQVPNVAEIGEPTICSLRAGESGVEWF